MFSCIWHLKHCKDIKQYSKLILDLFPNDLDLSSLVSKCKTLHDVEQDYCHFLVATSKTYLKLSKLVSTESGLEQPCFNFEKYYFCWATVFQPDLDSGNLVLTWKSIIDVEQPCFNLIWTWATLFHLGKAQFMMSNLVSTWFDLCFISEKHRWLSNLVSTWFGLEQSCFILEKHN